MISRFWELVKSYYTAPESVTQHCHILETGNDSFRFKNSSAHLPPKPKEKPKPLTAATDPKQN